MARPSVKDLKAFLDQKKNNKGGRKYNPDVYPFWQIEPGQEAVVRFLPGEGNEIYPFVERLDHKLTINGKVKNIPCPSMHGEKCPICDLSREYYAEEGDDSENGKHYYRDSVQLAKAIVISDPLPADPDTGETYEGKVVTLRLGYQIMQKINEEVSRLEDDEALPWDLEEGTNFTIKPVKQGKYKKYDIGSGFARRPSAIPKEYIKNIEIIDLDTLLPEVASFDEINEMLDAHLSGGSLENDKDSLESKKRESNSRSSSSGDDEEGGNASSRGALKRLLQDEGGEEDDGQEDMQSQTSGEDDDDDDDDDFRAIMAKVKNRNKG